MHPTEFARTLIRTAQIHFPALLDAKFYTSRKLRGILRIPHERDFSVIRLFSIPDDALFLDVGANRGQSYDAIRLFAPRAHIHLFEPNPQLASALSKRCAHNSRAKVHAMGLSDVDARFTLHLPVYKRWQFDGLAAFDRESAASWLRGRIFWYDDAALSIREIPCHARPLDGLGLHPFFIKIDVQGHELQVLKGAVKTLRQCEPVLLVETPDEQIVRFLNELGYIPYRYHDGRLEPNEFGSLNTIFLTRSKSTQVADHLGSNPT